MNSEHNVTIDDNADSAAGPPQLTYNPPSAWTHGDVSSPGGSVATATTSEERSPGPDPPTFSLFFNGTAIYVFGILTASDVVNISFILDDEPVGSYTVNPESDSFDVPFYTNASVGSASNRPGGQHNLTVLAWLSMQFDFALYTVPTVATPITSVPVSTSSSSSSTSTLSSSSLMSTSSTSASSTASHNSRGAVVGGIVGGLAALLAALLITAFWVRRRQRQGAVHKEHMKELVEPFPANHPTLASNSIPDPQSQALLTGHEGPANDLLTGAHGSVPELQTRLRQLQALLDSPQDTRSPATSQLAEEVLALRTHVAQLEAQHVEPWDPDEPPPAY